MRSRLGVRRLIGSNGQPITAGPVGGPPAPPPVVDDPQTIMAANCIRRWKSTNGVSVATGVNSWLDLVASQDFAQGTGANQPTYNATGGPNSKPSILFDGSNDSLATTMARAAPGTTPSVPWLVMRQITWSSNDPLLSDSAGTMIIRQTSGGASPQLNMVAGINRATNSAATLNTWARARAKFQNSTTDALQLLATDVTDGAAAGNVAGTAPLLGRNGASSVFANWEVCEICFFDAVPSGAQDTALDAYCTAEYGSGLV